MKNSLRWKIAQTVELLWWKRYLKGKPVQEYLDWKEEYWNSILDMIKESYIPVSEDIILDAGCGPAGVFMNLKNSEVDAIDPLLQKYSGSLLHFNPENYPNTTFTNVSIEDFMPQRKYDAVFCMNAINHVENIHTGWKVLADSTKPGGWMIVTIDAHNHTFYRKLFAAIPGDILHPHQYDKEEYLNMIQQHGFTIKSCQLIKSAHFFNHYLVIAKRSEHLP